YYPRPPPPRNSLSAYRPDIDGLRAFAVLAVIGYHYFPAWVKGGFVGVDVFFVISGFLIGGILLDALTAGRFSLIDFYMRRIRRIFPALILVMAAALAFGWFALLPDDYRSLGKHTVGGATFISNFLLWKEAGYFDVISERKPLLHLWSLGVEEQFYIIFPVFLWGLWCKKWRFVTFVFALLFVSLAYNLAVYKKHEVFDFYMPMTRFWELLAGSMIAAIQRSRLPFFSRAFLRCDAGLMKVMLEATTIENDGRTLRNCLSVLGVLVLVTAIFTTRMHHFPGGRALLPVLGAVCIIVAGAQGWGNRLLLSWRPMVLVGLISYPLYLWHWPLLSYARIILGEMPDRTFRIGLVAVAFVLATVTYLVIERPIRFGTRAKKLKVFVLFGLLLLVGGSGGVVYWQNGLPKRDAVVEIMLVAEELKNIDVANEDCRKRYGIDGGYCFYYDANAEMTVAVVGDSHAGLAAESIASRNAELGVNTVLFGHDGRKNPIHGYDVEPDFSNKVFSVLQENKNIRKVFLITRGPAYISGVSNISGESATKLGVEGFRDGYQVAVDRLRQAGKEVFIVTENPEWPINIRDMLPVQPLRPRREMFHLYKKDVQERQQEYLDILKDIKGAEIIYTLDAFCPADECLLLNEQGLPLYFDDDHLSAHAGGKFLVDKVLEPYLNNNRQRHK
ncbi:MAG: acyltransferase, partial [Zoogloeaceae bacterium]|nr:acyltransferase [Zoogloeaceae bacterium]